MKNANTELVIIRHYGHAFDSNEHAKLLMTTINYHIIVLYR
jgi:hypothetical protein